MVKSEFTALLFPTGLQRLQSGSRMSGGGWVDGEGGGGKTGGDKDLREFR